MLEILKINRIQKLKSQYKRTKAEAIKFMRSGDLKNYIRKLTEVQKIEAEYLDTLSLKF